MNWGMLYSRAVDTGCYACGEPTRRRCRECRHPYCNQHGDVICDECGGRAESAARRLPVSGLFSPTLFRVVLVLIVVGALLSAAPDVWARLAPALQAAAPPTPEPARPAGTPVQVIVPPAGASPKPSAATPITSTTATAIVAATGTVTATTTPSGPVVLRYTVAEGDDLRSIAERFSVSTQTIISYNNLADPDNLQLGQVLLIPK